MSEVCGLRQEEQDLFHRVVLPTGGYRGGGTLQHCPVSRLMQYFFGFADSILLAIFKRGFIFVSHDEDFTPKSTQGSSKVYLIWVLE